MALQIDIRQPDWMHEEALRDLLAPRIFRACPSTVASPTRDSPADVIMLATVKLYPGVAAESAQPETGAEARCRR